MHLCISYIIFKYLCANVFLFYIICHGCGLSALLPITTFGRTVSSTGTGRADRNDDSVRDGCRILISRMGGHALASPAGGGSCPLGTHYLLGLTHLAY